MDNFNYELKYAYTELYEILNYLGDEYKNKIPKQLMQQIKSERRIDYKPNFDFSKSLLELNLRQETKNLIAYLQYNYWLIDEKDKKELLEKIEENKKIKEAKMEAKRKEELRQKAGKEYISVTAALDRGLKKK